MTTKGEIVFLFRRLETSIIRSYNKDIALRKGRFKREEIKRRAKCLQLYKHEHTEYLQKLNCEVENMNAR